MIFKMKYKIKFIYYYSVMDNHRHYDNQLERLNIKYMQSTKII